MQSRNRISKIAFSLFLLFSAAACSAQSSSGGFAAQHCFENSTGYTVSIVQSTAEIEQSTIALTLPDETVRDIPLFYAQLTDEKQLTMCVRHTGEPYSTEQLTEWTVSAAENGWSLAEPSLTAALASYWQTDSGDSVAYRLTAPGIACFSIEFDGKTDYWVVLLDTTDK